MKTVKYLCILAMASFLMAADCSNKDSEFYNDVFVAVPNLVTVERSDVPANQTVFITAVIPRLLTVANLSKPLDIFKTTGGATRLVFSFELEKENTDGTWEYFEFSSGNIASINGESVPGIFVTAAALFNSVTSNYEYKSGIQGLTPGNYRLSFGYNSFATDKVEFRSDSVNNNLFLNLDSPANFLDAAGYYNFTIN